MTIAFKEETFENSKRLDLFTGYVSVKYILKNLDDEEKELDILFISPIIDSSSIKVKNNGEEIKGIEVDKELETPKNWEANTPWEIIEPFSNKELYKTPNNVYEPYFIPSGINFNIDLEPNEMVTLDISYESPSGFYRRDEVTSMVHSQTYYLTPAKFWYGDSVVNLRVEFPEGTKTRLHSNISLSEINSYTYEGLLDKIPDVEWIFTFVDASGLIFETNNRTIHNSMVFVILLVGIIGGIALRRKSYKFYGTILLLLSAAFFLYFIRPTYGSFFILYTFGPFIALGILIIFCVISFQKKKQI